ncbi:MAG: Trk system potassium transporter TrkA [Bacteroidaceae bacterium]|nr:Trk system potassium transporter TrkA [Bacteroidaceae bacterium]MBQ3188260.1 Trk system potassium transporter TrkA [Bacteroidaceae bacterium]
MKIVIAGAGAVGTHLAKMLSEENENVILMDEQKERLGKMESQFDLKAIVGNPTRISDLENANVDSADLFVAVTPNESTNITACILAHYLGAKKTIARIDNYEYLQPKNKSYFESLGVNSLIYPEQLAAEEIATSIKYSWMRQMLEFGNGALVMIGVKIRANSSILNKPFKELSRDIPYHIVALQRGDITIIPRGNDVIEPDDLVCFMTTKEQIPHIRKICGKEKYAEVRSLIIMGGSRIAVRTTKLIPSNMQVKIIESDMERCRRLIELVDDRVMVINGDARDPELLISEGIDHTDAFIALSDNSETNILACLSAKRSGVYRTVAEIENIDYISMAESMDIGSVINKKKLAASTIFQMMLKTDVSSVKCLTFIQAVVAEFPVNEGAPITRKPVKDLGLPQGANIGGLIRNGEGLRVSGNTMIQADDHVIIFCLEHVLKKLEKYFS